LRPNQGKYSGVGQVLYHYSELRLAEDSVHLLLIYSGHYVAHSWTIDPENGREFKRQVEPGGLIGYPDE
jgi:hypothetical protein